MKKEKQLDRTKFEKKSLEKLYFLSADNIVHAFTHLHNMVLALCEGSKIDFEKEAEEVIKVEKESDKYHDEIISRMFGRETLVFSRVDRIYVINELDNVIDAAEAAARRAEIYFPPEIPRDLAILMIKLSEKTLEIGKVLTETIKDIFRDFKKALEQVREIENIRRDARQIYQDFLKELYSHDEMHHRDFLYYDRLIRQIKLVVTVSNKFADGLRRLVFKYRL